MKIISGAAIEIGIGIGCAGDAGDDGIGALAAGFRRPVKIVAGGSAAGSPGQIHIGVVTQRRNQTGRGVRSAIRWRKRNATGQHPDRIRVVARACAIVEWTIASAPIKRTHSAGVGGINQILVPIVTGTTIPIRLRSREEPLPRRLKFADHHRNSFADILVNQLLKAGVHHAFFTPGGVVSWGAGIGIMVSRSPEVGSAHALRLREIEGRVVMIFHHQAVGNRVRRKRIQPRRVAAALQHQPAVGVVAAHHPDRVDKSLVVKHQRDHLSGIMHVRFITGSKQQMVVVTGKGGGNLGPVGFHLRVDDGINIVRNVALQPAVIPVIVDHDIHALRDGCVHRLFDLRHVSGTDHVVGDAAADIGGGAGHVPRARDAHGIKTGEGGRVEQRRLGRSPVQLQAISDIHPVGRIRPRHGGRDVCERGSHHEGNRRTGHGAVAVGQHQLIRTGVGHGCNERKCVRVSSGQIDKTAAAVELPLIIKR